MNGRQLKTRAYAIWVETRDCILTIAGVGTNVPTKPLERCAFFCRAARRETLYLQGMAGDHDHKTGKPRGILCRNCNMALGYMCDDPSRLRLAADYLEKSTQ